jgi:hypothetical protein
MSNTNQSSDTNQPGHNPNQGGQQQGGKDRSGQQDQGNRDRGQQTGGSQEKDRNKSGDKPDMNRKEI